MNDESLTVSYSDQGITQTFNENYSFSFGCIYNLDYCGLVQSLTQPARISSSLLSSIFILPSSVSTPFMLPWPPLATCLPSLQPKVVVPRRG